MITFNSIPTAIRVPFVAVEFDATRAQRGPALLPYRVLLIGQKTNAGTGVADTVRKVTSADQVLTLAGRGSLLHRMAMAHFANNRFTDTYIGILADHGSGVPATGTFTFTGPTTATGVLSVYIGGTLVAVTLASGTSAASAAAALTAAINANLDLPVTAAQGSGGDTHIVTVTARNDGTPGNDIDLRVNYQDGEALPAGLSVAIVAMASGATNASLTNLIAAMGDDWYQIIVLPYTDAASLTAIETELASRNGPMRMIDGVAITASNASLGNLSTLGDSRNSPYLSIVATNQSPTPTFEVAAAVGAVTAYYGNIDPARPFQTLPLAGVLPPAEADRFTLQERNVLLYDGISTVKAPPTGGPVQIERLITTSQTNAAGAPDTAYLDVTTRLTLMYLRYSFRTQIAARYPRHKLADDNVRFGPGQPVMTPLLGRTEAIHWFRDMEALGLVEGAEQFKQDLVVERDLSDPNRLNFLLPPDLINQLVVTAAQVQFRL